MTLQERGFCGLSIHEFLDEKGFSSIGVYLFKQVGEESNCCHVFTGSSNPMTTFHYIHKDKLNYSELAEMAIEEYESNMAKVIYVKHAEEVE